MTQMSRPSSSRSTTSPVDLWDEALVSPHPGSTTNVSVQVHAGSQGRSSPGSFEMPMVSFFPDGSDRRPSPSSVSPLDTTPTSTATVGSSLYEGKNLVARVGKSV